MEADVKKCATANQDIPSFLVMDVPPRKTPTDEMHLGICG